jgi:hypothetical protein
LKSALGRVAAPPLWAFAKVLIHRKLRLHSPEAAELMPAAVWQNVFPTRTTLLMAFF